MKYRVYLDTSTIGGCHDKKFEEWSNKLIDQFRQGLQIAVVSDITLDELADAPSQVRAVLDDIPKEFLQKVGKTGEMEELALLYIAEGAIPEKCMNDAMHIACATIERVHVLASWNFKHIVNLRRIQKFNSVNLKYGYPSLEIRSPQELLNPFNDE